jgi:Helix-turn-helix domain
MESETRNSPNATLQQAAAFLQVSERSVQNYQDRGLLSTVRFGRRRFFRWSELEKLAKKGVR